VRVVFIPEDKVELAPRPGFREPDRGRWTVEALNIEGREVEQRIIGCGVYWLPRNIPVIVPVDPGSPEAVNNALRIEKTDEWTEIPGFKGYLCRKSRLVDVWVKRDAKELAELAGLQGEPAGGYGNQDLAG
jgi:hypothetical protein